MRRQTQNGPMAKAHRDLAPVLEADRTMGLGTTGLVDLVGHRFVDVTAGGQAREMPGNAGCKPAHAVGCVSLVNRRFKGHADVWGSAVRDAASLQGVQCQLRPCTHAGCSQ